MQKSLVAAVGQHEADLIMKGDRHVSTSCGSGMTAAVLWLGLKAMDIQKVGLYDEVRFCIDEREICVRLFLIITSLGQDMLCESRAKLKSHDNDVVVLQVGYRTASLEKSACFTQ
jgi:hypothetical protein